MYSLTVVSFSEVRTASQQSFVLPYSGGTFDVDSQPSPTSKMSFRFFLVMFALFARSHQKYACLGGHYGTHEGHLPPSL